MKIALKNYLDKFEKRHLVMLIPLAGIAVSAWAVATSIAIMNQAGSIACDAGGAVNCSQVIGSRYGSILGVPLGWWGISFWLVALGLYILPFYHKIEGKLLPLARLVLASAGLAAAIALASISIILLRSFCMICETVQLLLMAYFAASLVGFLPARRESLSFEFERKPITIALGVLASLAIAPLVAGAIVASLTGVASPAFAHSEDAFEKLERDVLYKEEGVHSLGPKDARVKVTIYTDFQCPWCRRFHAAFFEELNKSGVKNVLVIFKDYPLDMHPDAKNIHLAARCAGRQGKFWEFANLAFEAAGKPGSDFSPLGLAQMAQGLGLDMPSFAACYDSRDEMARIEEFQREAEKVGLKGTPFMLLNDKPYNAPWTVPGRLARDLRVAAGLETDDGALFGYKEDRPLWSRFVPFYSKLAPITREERYKLFDSEKENVTSITLRDWGLMIMLLSDTNDDGKTDDFSWVMGSYREPQRSRILYTESTREDLRTRTWYGPGNIKIIAREDMDKNGTMETTVYYNEKARPQAAYGTVARFESDTNGDGLVDLWVYPGSRMEIDTTGDGMPNRYTIEQKQIQENMALFDRGVKREKFVGIPLAPGASWALNPALITNKANRALIPQSYPMGEDK